MRVVANERGGRGGGGQRKQAREHISLVLALAQLLGIGHGVGVVPQRAAAARVADDASQATGRGEDAERAARGGRGRGVSGPDAMGGPY